MLSAFSVSERIVGHADAVAGSRLSGDGEVAVADCQGRSKEDGARNVEDDGAPALLLDGPAECALLAIVGKAGDVIDSPSASACSISAISFGARECWHTIIGLSALRDGGKQ